MRYMRELLLEAETSCDRGQVQRAEETARDWLRSPSVFVVFEFYQAPEEFRKLCCYNGGDEDWLVLTTHETDYLPDWIEQMDSMRDPDVYVLNGVVIYVCSHA